VLSYLLAVYVLWLLLIGVSFLFSCGSEGFVTGEWGVTRMREGARGSEGVSKVMRVMELLFVLWFCFSFLCVSLFAVVQQVG
jgi:hypothetical protein